MENRKLRQSVTVDDLARERLSDQLNASTDRTILADLGISATEDHVEIRAIVSRSGMTRAWRWVVGLGGSLGAAWAGWQAFFP